MVHEADLRKPVRGELLSAPVHDGGALLLGTGDVGGDPVAVLRRDQRAPPAGRWWD
jgi:hypothetical protein